MSYQIVVLSYNHPQVTERCLRSVVEHGENPILIHNGSRSEHIAYLKAQFPQIEHRVIESNRGFSGGANFGLQEGFKLADRVFFLTNDCELTEKISEPNRPGVLAPLIWRRKIGEIDSIGGTVDLRTGIANHSRTKNSDQAHFYVPGSAFWIDRKSFERLGGFDETFGTYWEDIEMSLRAPSRNVLLGTDDQTRVLHRVGKTCHKDPHYTSYLYQRNRFVVCWRYLKTGRVQFVLKYVCSIASLAIRKARARQWSSVRLLALAVRDGWKMRN